MLFQQKVLVEQLHHGGAIEAELPAEQRRPEATRAQRPQWLVAGGAVGRQLDHRRSGKNSGRYSKCIVS